MATEFGQRVLNAKTPPIHVDGQPYDEWVRSPVVAEPERPPVVQEVDVSAPPSERAALNEASTDAMLLNDPTIVEDQVQARQLRQRTVNDELIDNLISTSMDNENIDPLVYEQLRTMDPEKQTQAILTEYERRHFKKMDVRFQMLLHASYTGHGQIPSNAVDDVRRGLSSRELTALSEQTRQRHNNIAYSYAAELGADFYVGETGEELVKMVATEFTPLFPLAVRQIISRTLVDTAGLETGTFRTLLPGEVQQDFREHLASLSPADQRQLMIDTYEALKRLSESPEGAVLADYLFIETIGNTMSPEFIDSGDPQNTLARSVENVAAVAEAVWLAAVLNKAGKAFRILTRGPTASKVRAAQEAVGANATVAAIDEQLTLAARRYDLSPGEVAAVNYPKPGIFVDDRTVLTAGEIRVLERADELENRILTATNNTAESAFRPVDKNNAIRRAQLELDQAVGLQPMPAMSVVDEIEDAAGFRVKQVYGKDADGGYRDVREALLDIAEYDPQLERVRILHRTADGTVEDLNVTADEMARLIVKNEIPERMVTQTTGRTLVEAEIGMDITKLGDESLVRLSKNYPKGTMEFEAIEREAMRRQGTEVIEDAVAHTRGDQYFVQLESVRYYHPMDKLGMDIAGIKSGRLEGKLVAPNELFPKDIYDPFAIATLREAQVSSLYDEVLQPFYSLNRASQRKIGEIIEANTHRKHHVTFSEIVRNYPELTPAERQGILAVRKAHDIQWADFNRRLHRDLATRGAITIRPDDGVGARYHGTLEPRTKYNQRGVRALNPKTGEIEALGKEAVDELYNAGGGIIHLDVPVDVAAGGVATRVVSRSGDYTIGQLSKTVLDYSPNYNPRFYKDPYVIMREGTSQIIDGAEVSKPFSEAVKTAPTAARATREARRLTSMSKSGNTYRAVRMRDLDQNLGRLYAKTVLQREGRMFWDKRNFERLRNIDGRYSDLVDPVEAISSSMAQAARQSSHEDVMKAMKSAFGREFRKLVTRKDIENKSARDIIHELETKRANAVSAAEKAQFDRAMALAKYLRMLEGIDEVVLPWYRGIVSGFAQILSRQLRNFRWADKPIRRIENYAATADPVGSLRSFTFRAMLVTRPVRQAVLQTAQVTMLMRFDPLYVGSGKFFKDALLLKRGYANVRSIDGVMDGMSDAAAAKMMGVSKAEYHRLVREYDRSGLHQSVNRHSFKGANTVAPRPTDQPFFRYIPGRLKDQTFNFLERIGFDWGETNNLAATWLLAARQIKKQKKYKSFMDFSKADWQEAQITGSNLALAMIKANNMPYQSGVAAMTMQFMAFSHRAALSYLGLNPATKGKALGMFLTSLGLWGLDMFGAKDATVDWLTRAGAGPWMDKDLGIDAPGGDPVTIRDAFEFGMIDYLVNDIVLAATETRLDLEPFAPGVNTAMIYRKFIEDAWMNPQLTVLGPSLNSLLPAFKAVSIAASAHSRADGMPPLDKAALLSRMWARETFPGFNDVDLAIQGYHLGQLVQRNGEALPLQSDWTKLIARGVFGLRSEEELAYYNLTSDYYNRSGEAHESTVSALRTYLRLIYANYFDGTNTLQDTEDMLTMFHLMLEAYPEEERMDLYEKAFLTADEAAEKPSVADMLVQMMEQGRATAAHLANLDKFPDMPEQVKADLRALFDELEQARRESGTRLVEDQ